MVIVMKIIFLDIDGVLNTSQTFKNRYYEYKRSGNYSLEIDDFRVELLEKVVKETHAKIVLSSTWRKGFAKKNDVIVSTFEKTKQLVNVFSKHNLEIYDVTPYDENLCRQKEILQYLKSRKDIESFVIFDDEASDLSVFVDKELILVHNDCTDFNEERNGLLKEHVLIAIEKLNKDLNKGYVKRYKG